VQIRNVTKEDLDKALAEVNKRYDNNIFFNNFEAMNQKGNAFRVTLRVRSSHGKGARLNIERTRHLPYACWHVHGDFFDNLLIISPQTIIKTAKLTIHKDSNGTVHGNWEDWNIGSIIEPCYFSEACGCSR